MRKQINHAFQSDALLFEIGRIPGQGCAIQVSVQTHKKQYPGYIFKSICFESKEVWAKALESLPFQRLQMKIPNSSDMGLPE